ncbi:hypothetical protein Btru_057422 [Bulinus truncatus]|nr:hypothetical protein Btru_057422 [Bulinus truncatus]
MEHQQTADLLVGMVLDQLDKATEKYDVLHCIGMFLCLYVGGVGEEGGGEGEVCVLHRSEPWGVNREVEEVRVDRQSRDAKNKLDYQPSPFRGCLGMETFHNMINTVKETLTFFLILLQRNKVKMTETLFSMATSSKLLQLPILHNFTEPGTWLLTFLCCAYAMPHTSRDDSVLGVSYHHHLSYLPVSRKSPCLAQSPIGKCRHKMNSMEIQFRSLESQLRNNFTVRDSPQLTTLKLIKNWAKQNRKHNPRTKLYWGTEDLELNHHLWAHPQKDGIDKRAARPYDKKVFVFGKDDRQRIFPPLMRKFPYSNIVRLSTGCTGTLVTPLHVLTAAHCVHTGTVFRNKLEMLKVEVPDTLGVRVYYVEKISIPSRWLHPKSIHEHRSSWDYAVVRLSYGVHDRKQFFPLDVPSPGVLNHNLQFLGFPNSEDSLLMSVCPAKSNKAMVDWNLILTKCDSAVGNSGAAVLSDDSPREGKKIIGILSSTMPVGRMPYYTPFSIITALTFPKLYDICTEIGDIGVSYQVCPPIETIPKPLKININNNIIPFFG